ncbi:MAG: hypothetical protein NT100_18480, partial [Rhodococcus sp.]|nr:hypothetical protein [Rhodococcus sp. (in: high G+C Gram-positive bacteria)]
LQTGQLVVAGGAVGGEGTRATRVEDLLLAGGSPTQLADLGVGWVLIERETPGQLGKAAATLDGLEQVFADNDLELYRVPGDVAAQEASTGARTAVIVAHLAWILMGVIALISVGLNQNRIRLARRGQS